ncbi:hypothetical protein KB976_000314 [Vibrio parahaemolyticus]|nr:hypothetical protein [Vibrio parahaemolyticus]
MKAELKALLFIGFAIVFLALIGWILMPVNKMVERQVLVNSHQYIEGQSQRAATLRANIAEIDAMLANNPENRDQLLAQKRALTAMYNATLKSN